MFCLLELEIYLELLSKAINWTYFIFISIGINFSSMKSVYLTISSGKKKRNTSLLTDITFTSRWAHITTCTFRFVIGSSVIIIAVNRLVFMKFEFAVKVKISLHRQKNKQMKNVKKNIVIITIMIYSHERYCHLCAWKIVGHENSYWSCWNDI